jgi:hypothetical protein
MEELIKLQKEYIEFLGNRYNDAYLIAHIHHYQESDENIEKGKALRNQIKECEDRLQSKSFDRVIEITPILGEIYIEEGVQLRCVKPKEKAKCTGCFLRKKDRCEDYNCISHFRSDHQDIILEVVDTEVK